MGISAIDVLYIVRFVCILSFVANMVADSYSECQPTLHEWMLTFGNQEVGEVLEQKMNRILIS